jgi:hypothetical protein
VTSFFSIVTSEIGAYSPRKPIKELTVGTDREEAKRKFEAGEMINN